MVFVQGNKNKISKSKLKVIKLHKMAEAVWAQTTVHARARTVFSHFHTGFSFWSPLCITLSHTQKQQRFERSLLEVPPSGKAVDFNSFHFYQFSSNSLYQFPKTITDDALKFQQVPTKMPLIYVLSAEKHHNEQTPYLRAGTTLWPPLGSVIL